MIILLLYEEIEFCNSFFGQSLGLALLKMTDYILQG